MLLRMEKPSIHTVAQVMVASFPAIPHAQLFYRALETDKTKTYKGDFEATMTYSLETKNDLKLGDNNASTAAKHVLLFSPDFKIQSNASLLG